MITSPGPTLSLTEISDTFQHKPSALFHQHQTRGSQCHSKLHTCAQIKISPLTLPEQTQLILEVSFQSPWLALTASSPEPDRGGQEEVYYVEAGRWGKKSEDSPESHTGYFLQTVEDW